MAFRRLRRRAGERAAEGEDIAKLREVRPDRIRSRYQSPSWCRREHGASQPILWTTSFL